MPKVLDRPTVPARVYDTKVTSPAEAMERLSEFANANMFSDAVLELTLDKFRAVDAARGQPVIIWEFWQEGDEAEAHDLFETIVDDPVAQELTVIAIDARPGTQFRTFEMRDNCGSKAMVMN